MLIVLMLKVFPDVIEQLSNNTLLIKQHVFSLFRYIAFFKVLEIA